MSALFECSCGHDVDDHAVNGCLQRDEDGTTCPCATGRNDIVERTLEALG